MKSSLLIYDYSQFYIESLKGILLQGSLFDKVAATIEKEEFLKLVQTGSFRFIITSDVLLHVKEMCEFMDEFKTSKNKSHILYIGNTVDIRDIRKLFEHGISGFLEPNVNLEEVTLAVKTIKEGNIYICSNVKDRMLNYLSFQDNCLKHDGEDALTKRELEVMKLICEGISSKQISEKLFISVNTVETHRKKILMKLNVKNSVGVLKYALDNKMLE